MSRRTTLGGGVVGPTLEAYQLDMLNRPATVGSAATFGYEGRGLKSRVSYAGGVSSRWSYDAARRPTGRSTTFPPGAVATPLEPTLPWQPNVIQEAMAWSPRGERTGVVGSLGLEGGFRASYDPAGRLTGRSTLQGKNQLPLPNLPPLAPAALESTVYDTSPAQHLAERKTKSTLRPLEAVTGLPEDGTGRNRPGALAAPGGVGSMALAWDANGNLTAKGDLRLSYDFRNRLREVRDAASGETLASFDYDAFNRRVTKQSFGRTTETVWSGWRALEERQGGQLRFRKIYGLGLDELVRVESDSDLNGTLETAYLPLYDELSNLTALTDTTGKPIVRYEHGAFGEERRVAVDLERPKAVQITTRGRDTIVVEMSEEISRTELERALAAGGVVLSRTAITGGSAAKAAKSNIALTAAPASEEGQSPRQRWVFTLAEPANPGEEVELAFDTGALVDGFLNTPEAITRIRFPWPTSTERTVVQDSTAPEVRQVGLIGGVLEVVLREEPNLAAASTALTLDGQPVAWQLSADGYALRTPQPLTPGDHELQLTTNPLDLAGNGLAAADTLPFTWNGTTQLETLLTGTKRAEKSLIDDVAALNVGFQGQPYDPETGLYYFRNRWYDPELARFITADPLGYVDGPSLYAFAGGDPVNGRDPLGLTAGADLADFWRPIHDERRRANPPGPGNPRAIGVLEIVGGCGESVGALVAATLSGGTASAASAVSFTHGYDTCHAGFRALVTGEPSRPAMLSALHEACAAGGAEGQWVGLCAATGDVLISGGAGVLTGRAALGLRGGRLVPGLGSLAEDVGEKVAQEFPDGSLAGGKVGHQPRPVGEEFDLSPWEVNFSQRTVSWNVIDYMYEMVRGRWDWSRPGSGPLPVMYRDGQWVAYSNRRPLAARLAGLPSVPLKVVDGAAPSTVTGLTWEQAFVKRFNDPRNIEAGGVVPNSGLRSNPTVVLPTRRVSR